jgi:hypothetical protein
MGNPRWILFWAAIVEIEGVHGGVDGRGWQWQQEGSTEAGLCGGAMGDAVVKSMGSPIMASALNCRWCVCGN